MPTSMEEFNYQGNRGGNDDDDAANERGGEVRGDMNQQNGLIASPTKINVSARQKTRTKPDDEKKARSRKEPTKFTYHASYIKTNAKTTAAPRSKYDKIQRKQNQKAFNEIWRRHKRNVATEKRRALQQDRKPKSISMGLGAPRPARRDLSGLMYIPQENGSLVGDNVLVNDGTYIRSQYSDLCPDHVAERISSCIQRNTHSCTSCNIATLNIEAAIDDLYKKWKQSRRCFGSDPRGNDEYCKEMLTSGMDLLADGAIVEASTLTNQDCDSMELVTYARNGGCFYYCANIATSPRLLRLIDYHLSTDGHYKDMDFLIKDELECNYCIQVYAYCRVSFEGRGQSKCISQFAMDSFVLAIDTADESNNPSQFEDQSDLPLVVVYQAASSLMKGTYCLHRIIQIAQHMHYLRRKNKTLLVKMPETHKDALEEIRSNFGKTRPQRAATTDPATILKSESLNDDLDKIVYYLCNESSDKPIVQYADNQEYETIRGSLQLSISTYTQHISYDVDQITFDGHYQTLKKLFLKTLDLFRTDFPVKKLSREEADGIVKDVLNTVNLSAPRSADEIKESVATAIGKLGELPLSAILHPIMTRTLIGTNRGAIHLRHFPFQLLQNISIYIAKYDMRSYLHRGDCHQCRIRCLLCGADYGIKAQDNQSSFPMVLSMSSMVAAVHYGIVSYDSTGDNVATFDLRDTVDNFYDALKEVRDHSDPTVEVCPMVKSADPDNKNDMTYCTIDALRQDLYDIRNSVVVRKNTRQLLHIMSEEIRGAWADNILQRSGREPISFDYNKLESTPNLVDSDRRNLTNNSARLVARICAIGDDMFRRTIKCNEKRIQRICHDLRRRTRLFTFPNQVFNISRLGSFRHILEHVGNHSDKTIECMLLDKLIKFPSSFTDWRIARHVGHQLFVWSTDYQMEEGWDPKTLARHFGRDVEEDKYLGKEKRSEIDNVKMVSEDHYLLHHMTHVQLIVNPRKALSDGVVIPNVVKHDFFLSSSNASSRKIYVITSDLSQLSGDRCSEFPFGCSIGNAQSFIEKNSQWMANRHIISMLPKEFIDKIEANEPPTAVPVEYIESIRRNILQCKNSRIAMIQLQSSFPKNVWKILLVQDEANYLEANRWKFVTDVAMEDWLDSEPWNNRLLNSFCIQANHRTIVIGAGKKSSCKTPSSDNISNSNDQKETVPPVVFEVSSTNPPRATYWYLGTNDYNLCVVASLVNWLAAMGAYDLAQEMKATVNKTDAQIVADHSKNLSVGECKEFEIDLMAAASDEMNKSLTLMKYICKSDYKVLMEQKRWEARVLIEQVDKIKLPVLVEMVGMGSKRSHVVVIFDGHIICPESTLTYPCCMENLNFTCGEKGIFDQVRKFVAIIPSMDLQKSYNEKRRSEGAEVYNWDMETLQRKKRRFRYNGKQRRSKK